MSDVKIFRMGSGDAATAKLEIKVRPVADRLRGIGLASGAFSHGTYVIQMREQAPPEELRRSWAQNESDEAEDEAAELETQTVKVRS